MNKTKPQSTIHTRHSRFTTRGTCQHNENLPKMVGPAKMLFCSVSAVLLKAKLFMLLLTGLAMIVLWWL
jgi:hypothetical protein